MRRAPKRPSLSILLVSSNLNTHAHASAADVCGHIVARPKRLAVRVAFCATALMLFLGPAAAHATFPGTNGKIAFQSLRTGNYEIFAMNPSGGGQSDLSNNPAIDQDVAWSPDGTKLAFST